jgi:hypothetical protein
MFGLALVILALPILLAAVGTVAFVDCGSGTMGR